MPQNTPIVRLCSLFGFGEIIIFCGFIWFIYTCSSLGQSCDCKLWKWFKEPSKCFYNIKNSLMEKWHDDIKKWKHFPRYWSFVWGIHRSPVNSPHKGQWRGALMFSLMCAWINGWVNNREAGDLRHHRAHYNVIVMNEQSFSTPAFCIPGPFCGEYISPRWMDSVRKMCSFNVLFVINLKKLFNKQLSCWWFEML